VGDQIGVRLRGRPSAQADVPLEAANLEGPAGARYPQTGLPTLWLEQGRAAEPPDAPLRARPRQSAGSGHNVRLYQAVGLVQPAFGGRVGLGIYALLPYRQFTGAAAFYSDEREQYFSNSLHPELYADRLDGASLAFGLGGRLLPRLSVGAAVTLALRTQATTPTYLADVGRFEQILVDSQVGVNMALAPHFGLVYRPRADTSLSATVHTPQKLQVSTEFSFLLANGIEQSAAIEFTHTYLPWSFAFAAAHDLPGAFTLSATAQLALWSGYLDRHSERPHPAFAWRNTLSGVLGVRRHLGLAAAGTVAFLDIGYQPSPVPDQTGRSNQVDNDRLSASTGIDLRGRLLGGVVHGGLQVQAHRLLPRETYKQPPTPGSPPGGLVLDEVPDDALAGGQAAPGRDGLQTNNPGWPGFSSAGWILAASLTLGLGF
jgi:long-chain fatty acid transport protein